MATGNEPVHPAAELFPMMSESEFAQLVDDMRENGQHEPIVYWRQQLLDGRNRLRACKLIGIQPDTCEINDDDDPYQWVISANLHRRHLTESQRAMVAARLQELYRPEAEERQKASLKKGDSPVPVNLPERGLGDSRDRAAAALNVSPKSVSDAAAVIKSGSEELIAAVNGNAVTVSRAAKAARSGATGDALLKAATNKPAKKTTTPFEHLCRWWEKSDKAAQTRFRLWIDGECD